MSVKRIFRSLCESYDKLIFTVGLLSVGRLGIAEGIIPISVNDQTTGDSDFATTAVKIIQKEILPFIEILGAVWILWTAIATMANGVKEAQEKQKFDPLKNAIIKTVLVVVVGGALLYLLDHVRTFTFS